MGDVNAGGYLAPGDVNAGRHLVAGNVDAGGQSAAGAGGRSGGNVIVGTGIGVSPPEPDEPTDGPGGISPVSGGKEVGRVLGQGGTTVGRDGRTADSASQHQERELRRAEAALVFLKKGKSAKDL